uniref:Cilia and flagella associated protein 20 n=1 Tax=Paramormyrops kingsleyae TaxID=1676925 RepID=A0A3B3Q7V5_9TELE
MHLDVVFKSIDLIFLLVIFHDFSKFNSAIYFREAERFVEVLIPHGADSAGNRCGAERQQNQLKGGDTRACGSSTKRKMFKNTFQSGFLSILYSIGSKPLQIWDKKVRNGHIKRITDNDIQSLVLEVEGTNVSTTYITCPADPKKTLGIKLPFLVMIIKNLKKYFTFEVQVLDDKNVRRRFRASNYQSTTRVKPFICTMPMRLDDGWNQIQFNLSDFTRRAYGTNYIETLRVQIHANCRIRRVYFSDRLYSEDELPAEFKLYLPVQNKAKQ